MSKKIFREIDEIVLERIWRKTWNTSQWGNECAPANVEQKIYYGIINGSPNRFEDGISITIKEAIQRKILE